MFDSHQKSIGTGYTSTVALLAVAFIFIPVGLFISRPVGYGLISLAIICNAVCVAFAWTNWKRSSRLTMPSIMTPSERAE